MPEAVVKIENKILEKGEIKKLTAMLELPATREQIEQTLRGLYVEGAGENGKMHVSWLDSNQLSFHQFRWESQSINHIYEINHLAERVMGLDNMERVKLEALCSRYLDEMRFFETQSPEYEPTIAHAINLTHNLADIKVLEAINSLRDLGRFCISNKCMPELENLSDAVVKYLDRDHIADDYHDILGGCIAFGNYVYNIPAYSEMINPYDGKNLLIEQEPEEEPEQICGMTMDCM